MRHPRKILLTAGLATACLLSAGCTAKDFGFPRVQVEATSPSGSQVAYVRNHPSIDPPNQSLWMKDLGTGKRTKLRKLGEDADWCNAISWSGGGDTVAFLIQDAWVAVYDKAGNEVAVGNLVQRGGYPTTTEARELEFNDDASGLRFTECHRRSGTECRQQTVGLDELSLDRLAWRRSLHSERTTVANKESQ